MGTELACTLRHAGKTYSGKAFLESNEIVFRGGTRLKIPLTNIKGVEDKEGKLYVRTKDGISVFELGPQAGKWREKILNPKSVLDKLGVKSAESVSLIGDFPDDFETDLKKKGAEVARGKPAKDSQWIFFLANEKFDLIRLSSFTKSIQGSTALWLVYPKGQKAITEADVRSAGLKAGLVDIKVVSFSATYTALKFVLPKSKR